MILHRSQTSRGDLSGGEFPLSHYDGEAHRKRPIRLQNGAINQDFDVCDRSKRGITWNTSQQCARSPTSSWSVGSGLSLLASQEDNEVVLIYHRTGALPHPEGAPRCLSIDGINHCLRRGCKLKYPLQVPQWGHRHSSSSPSPTQSQHN